MLCPNCGQEIPDQETICPGCGEALPEPQEPSVTEEETVSIPMTEDVPETENASVTEDAPETEDAPATEEAPETAADAKPAGKKKKPTLAIILTAIIGLLLIVVVCMAVVLTSLSKNGEMPSVVTSITDWFERVRFDGDAVALTLQDQEGNAADAVTNEELSYYYWGEYYYFVQNYGFVFDSDLPLDQQNYDDSQTWQDYFLSCAETSILQVRGLKAEAEAAGFQMPEEYQAEYDNTIASMGDYALQAGFTGEDGAGDVLAYVQDSYGPAATMASFEQYLYDSYYVTAYSDQLYLDLSYSDEEVENYYDENSDLFTSYGVEKSDKPNVNVRHILIEPEADEDGEVSDEAWEDAKAEAERVLEEWKDGDATEDSFGELANQYSADTGSNTTGGLYEDVAPGQMVTEFNDWIFDDARQPGDTDIVKTTYGYHIMYYVSATENYYWRTTAESELRYQDYNNILSDITAKYTTVPTDKLDIPTPDAFKTIQQEAQADTAAGSAAG